MVWVKSEMKWSVLTIDQPVTGAYARYSKEGPGQLTWEG